MSAVVELPKVDRRWVHRAACRNADATLISPAEDADAAAIRRTYAYARTFCAGCPVRLECLVTALATETGGAQCRGDVAGGYEPADRTDGELMARAVDALARGLEPPVPMPAPPGAQPCGNCTRWVPPHPSRVAGTTWWCSAGCAKTRGQYLRRPTRRKAAP